MTFRRAVPRALALTTAAVGLTLTAATSAGATTVTEGGLIPNTSLDYYGCRGNIHGGADLAALKGYARAIFDVPTVDNRGYSCQGWFQRSTDNAETWSRIGDVHTGGVSSTAWYYADASDGYWVRVCVGDITASPNSYVCSRAVSVEVTYGTAAAVTG
ncbi:hypothetical protein [Streptomyces sp. NPDC021224]|uniref:hypothetical protein n=1 Tax=unclassified Streptomyces TaxID=2593676 RepID=UPI003796013E